MQKFEILDHTADTGIIAYGRSPEEVFVNAAYGMVTIITDVETVNEVVKREISAEAFDQEELLVTWLNELLYLFDAEFLLFSRFEIQELTDERIRAIAYGEKVDPSRHNLKTHVKAATYHSLKLEEKEDGFQAQVIFDV
ncbi:MAG: archease [Dehalococcoidia bacterium]